MFDNETSMSRLRAIIRWHTFSDKKVREAKKRISQLKRKRTYYRKTDYGMREFLNYVGTL